MIEEKEMIKLIAIDMDGTLLNDEKKIPKEISKLLKKQLKQVLKLYCVLGDRCQVYFLILMN